MAPLPATSRWIPLKVSLILLRIEEMDQELSAVLGENEQLLQQKRTQDSENVWEQRYQELLGKYTRSYTVSNLSRKKWLICKTVEAAVAFPMSSTSSSRSTARNYSSNTDKFWMNCRNIEKQACLTLVKWNSRWSTRWTNTCRTYRPIRTSLTVCTIKMWNCSICWSKLRSRMRNWSKKSIKAV